ncbi:MAG: ArnT family glycosyltransferase [Elainellaceae cyanobacterium]
MHRDSPSLLRIKRWLVWIDRQSEWLIWGGLMLAAVVLFTINLGGVPLRDWDEGTVAQVAREIWRSPSWEGWLYPSLHSEPYLNKPPLVHWLMAIAFSIGGVNEWTARLPGALLTAVSVPLLYGIGREVFIQRTTAVFAGTAYLAMLPVARHGRLAMLDGAVLCFFLVMIWSLLRSRRSPRWALGVGIGFGLICMTKGALGLLLGAIALLFLLWDAPRMLASAYLWLGVFIGSAPVIAWYAAQWMQYGGQFLTTHVMDQSFDRLWESVENNAGPPWFYALEILKYGFPWLLFAPMGFRLAWGDRSRSWAKLVLVWSIGYFSVISLIGTKLPWYVLPVYPALALVVGVELNRLWQTLPGASRKLSPSWRYIGILLGFLGLLAIAGWSGSVYFSQIESEPNLAIALAALGLTLTIASIQLAQRHREFIAVLIWGFYLTLLVLMASDQWVWELAEEYPVKPVAQLIQQNTPPDQVIYTSHPHGRPSLEFYSDRRVISVQGKTPQLRRHWRTDDAPYLLLDEDTRTQLKLKQSKSLGRAEGFVLVTRDRS